MKTLDTVFDEIKHEFEDKSGLKNIQSELKERVGSSVLILNVANPTERLYQILEQVKNRYETDTSPPPLVTLGRQTTEDLLQGSEGKLLLRTLAESLNINRYSFQEDFLARYTESVSGAEEQVVTSANHVVFGRRGAGKSTLLLFAMHTRDKSSLPSVWIDMQIYARREDDAVISDVLLDILDQVSSELADQADYSKVKLALQAENRSLEAIRKQLPDFKRLLARFARQESDLFVFLDDFHVLSETLQPKLLDVLYALSRGNKVFLKIAAIETLTRTYDPQTKDGLQINHDAQRILLDYNLTIPDKATKHIESILDSHALYCGLPSIRRLCTRADVLSHLTWVAAGVPRDALSLFSQAMIKAIQAKRKQVSMSNVNMAASEALNTKMRDLESDISGNAQPLQELQEAIKEFCVTQHRCNAFLVEIKNDDPIYRKIRTLVDLRLLHVINEEITPNEAGRKYLGLILDYGFYTGIRAARSVKLFDSTSYKELRKLPVFKG